MMAYSWLIDSYEKGDKILVENSSGVTKEVELFKPF